LGGAHLWRRRRIPLLGRGEDLEKDKNLERRGLQKQVIYPTKTKAGRMIPG